MKQYRVATGMCLLSVILVAGSMSAAEIHHAQGEFAGEVTANSVILQSRLTTLPGPEVDAQGDLPGVAGVACFEWSEFVDFRQQQQTPWLKAVPENDFIVRTQLANLTPQTLYYYRLKYGSDPSHANTGSTCQFKTLPDLKSNQALSFVMGSCQNYAFFMHGKDRQGPTASAQDIGLGYPAYQAMAELKPDFFIGTGDIVYYDHFSKDAAQSLPELRKKWHEQFRLPRLVQFFAKTPAYWSKDDHDFRFNDADLSGQKLPLPQTGIDLFREQMPIVPQGDQQTPTYRTHRVHRHLQLWFTEGRDYRSANNQPDGPTKTIWGKAQRQWLEQSLKASDATWKIIITPTPMVGPDTASKQDNHANLQGFRYEADDFFAWVKATPITNLMTFCGDRHWQYHSIHPLGVEEFSCGALNDENAIAGVKPGQPKSSDPQGLIQQKFLYPRPTGGFLHVTVSSLDQPQLTIRFLDDTGKLQYQETKPSK